MIESTEGSSIHSWVTSSVPQSCLMWTSVKTTLDARQDWWLLSVVLNPLSHLGLTQGEQQAGLAGLGKGCESGRVSLTGAGWPLLIQREAGGEHTAHNRAEKGGSLPCSLILAEERKLQGPCLCVQDDEATPNLLTGVVTVTSI